MTLAQVEARVAALELEMQQVKSQNAPVNKADPQWVLAHAGRFADDPGFEEVVRLGRAYRESLRPKPKKKPKVKAAVKNGRP